jgi:hypothetical protein
MSFKFLKIMGIGFILSVKKLLPILFLFTGFQANAVVIGNLTYDGTYISGDGRTYLGLDTIASWDYAKTLAATTEVNGEYEEFRIANTADADYFIGSLFGADADGCSTVDGTASISQCGILNGWADGVVGDSYNVMFDIFFFIADESPTVEVGTAVMVASSLVVNQDEQWGSIPFSDNFSFNPNSDNFHIPWLLVKDTYAQVDEPSILALMALGIFGIGFARRGR